MPPDVDEPLWLVNAATRIGFLDDIAILLNRQESFNVVTLNLDHVVKYRHDEKFRNAYRKATHIVADGHPVAWFHRMRGGKLELFPGSEMIEPICDLARKLNVKVGLVGSTPKTLAVAKDKLEAKYANLRITLTSSPPFGFLPEGQAAMECIKEIQDSGVSICILALGSPKQEVFAALASKHVAACGFICAGAGLDFIAGTQKRAPAWSQKLALEWLWRLVTNPRRLGQRYLLCMAILPRLSLAVVLKRSPLTEPNPNQPS